MRAAIDAGPASPAGVHLPRTAAQAPGVGPIVARHGAGRIVATVLAGLASPLEPCVECIAT